MSNIPFRIIDLIMKYAGAYSQDPYKAKYLEDIKLCNGECLTVVQSLSRIHEYHNKTNISWEIFGQMLWGHQWDDARYYIVELERSQGRSLDDELPVV
jgi:hypothetical protein